MRKQQIRSERPKVVCQTVNNGSLICKVENSDVRRTVSSPSQSKIQVLFMQDFEGRLFPQDIQTAFVTAGTAAGTILSSDAGRPVSGLAHIKTLFDQERQNNKHTIFLLGAEAYCSSNRTAYRVTNSYFYYQPTKQALNFLGLVGRGLAFHDFTDESFSGGPTTFGSIDSSKVTSVGFNDPLGEMNQIKPYLIIEVDGVKIAYISIADNRTSSNTQAPLNNPAYPVSARIWGNGGISYPTNLLTLITAANAARNQAAAAGAQVFILQVHRGFSSGGTGNTTVANAVGFDVMFFDNSAQTIGGFRLDGQGRRVLIAEPWSQGEEYSRFTIVYDKINNKIDRFEGKNGVQLLPGDSDSTIMKKIMVPVFADVVVPDPDMEHLLECWDAAAHEDLDVKIATLTRNVTLTASNVGTLSPADDRAAFLNLAADSLRAAAGTDIAFVSRFLTGFSPSPPLAASRQLVQYFQPRDSNFNRTSAPFDLLKGDIWDSIYNEVGTNMAARSTSMTVQQLFDTLEYSVKYQLTPSDVMALGGLSGFTFVFKSTNAFGSRVQSVTIGSTTYTRQPDNSVPGGATVISAATEFFTLLTQSIVAGVPDYPLINTSAWTPLGAGDGYGYVVDAIIAHLESLGIFDPDNATYNNRYTVI